MRALHLPDFPWDSLAADKALALIEEGLEELREFGLIEEVTSPDDNLQAVFRYLVKQ